MLATVILAVLGIALVVAGVAFIYWPAALVVAGVALTATALLIDTPTGRGRS